MKNCPFWLPMKLLFKPTDPRYSVFHKILSAKDMPRLFMGSIQERRAFFGCDMNTLAGSVLSRLATLWHSRASAVGGLVAMADFVPGVKHTRARVWLRRPADGCLVAAVLAW